MSSFLERLVQALFRGPAEAVDAADRPLVDDAIEAFVETVEPRVRLRSGYHAKLAGSAARTIAHLRALVRAPLGPVLLCRAAWSEDPRVHAHLDAAAIVKLVDPHAHTGLSDQIAHDAAERARKAAVEARRR